MKIEFRQSEKIPNWFNVLVDDEARGWIHKDDSIWKVTLWLDHQTIDWAKGFGSLESAIKRVRGHYEAVLDFPDIIGG